MTVLRYTAQMIEEHETLADAAAAQVLDELNQRAGVARFEDLDDPGVVLPGVRAVMALFTWRVVVYGPGHGHGTLSVHTTKEAANGEVARLAAIIGDHRVHAAAVPALVAGV